MAALCLYLHTRHVSVGVMKPIETGTNPNFPQVSDAGLLQTIAQVDDPLSDICPYALPEPLAPLSSARRHGVTIMMHSINQAYRLLSNRYSCMLVEGVGGVMVPIDGNVFLVDMISLFQLPVVVVGRAALGGINHLLLTLDRLQRQDLTVLAVVLNQIDEVPRASLREQQMTSTIELATELSGVPVLGPLPSLQGTLNTPSSLEPLARSAVIRELGERIMAGVPKKI